jgi:protease-4
MIKSVVIFSILILICANAWADRELVPGAALLPSASVAVSDDAMATTFNPAGLGIKSGTNGYYLHTFSQETGGDNAFFISSSGFGFGAEFVNPGWVDFTKYTLSDGMKLFNGFYLGSSYAWFGSKDEDYDRLSSWDLGLLCRPSRLLSMGLVARNLNRSRFHGKRIAREYDLSLALRPYTNRLTFSVDGEFQQGQKLKDTDVTYALEYEPVDGILLRGSYKSDGHFDLRVGIGFTQFQVGAYSQYDSDWNRGGGAAYAKFSGERHRTRFPKGHYILEMKPGDLDQLQRAKEDETVNGIIVKLGLDGYSMGRTQEMRDAILDFRSSGKRAVCYMDLAGDKEYYLAAACDEVVLNSAGYLSLDGLRSEVTFYKGALDKIGVEADLYRIGKYKSAAEMFTRDSMSNAYRESLNSTLDDLYEQMVSGIAEGRGISAVEVRKRIDQGPYTAREAAEAGLVDSLIYADQLKEVKERVFGKKTTNLPGKQYRRLQYHEYDWVAKPKLAVIYATGMIAPGKSMFTQSPILSIPRIMGSETITDALKKAREDSSIKAIVLRIDSGGGSVFASDLIWREVMLTKRKKPLIVSMGGMAASGGYYIACPADVIVADPGTVTGSIGVIAGKFSLRGLYDRLGISKEILKRGENSDIYTLYNNFTDEQREIVNRHIQEFYHDFVRKVAQGRNISEEAVESVAQGRVWTGKQARDRGLVDELGGLQLAISIAKSRAGLKPDEDVDIVAFPKRIPLWRRFILEGTTSLPEALNLTLLLDFMKAAERLTDDRIFFLMPYTAEYE